MRPRLIGWTLVAAQVVLLATVAVLPRRHDWPTPGPVEVLGWALVAAGAVVVAMAAADLGHALTPTPEPKQGGQLRTDGAYAWVRHPIYSGVLLAVAGLTLRSGSITTAAVATITFAFFVVKASWEERRLAVRYPGYDTYASGVGRFVPRRARPGADRQP